MMVLFFFPGQLNVLFCFFKYTAHGDLVGLGALRTVLSALYASQASSFVSFVISFTFLEMDVV